MIITKDAWVEIAGGACTIIKQSTYKVDISFSTNSPVEATDRFTLDHNELFSIPNLNGNVWARAKTEDVNLVVGTGSAL
jgi:hypothetical protein